MNRETVGKISSELLSKSSALIDPQEIQRASEQECIDNLVWCVKHAKKEVSCADIDGHDFCKNRPAMTGDFYVVGLVKKERLMINVVRNQYLAAISCPTPHFDQTVYRYNDKKGDIEFLWVVPDQETCEIFRENKHIIVPGERALLKFVLDFYNGTLFNLAKKLNGETKYAGDALIK